MHSAARHSELVAGLKESFYSSNMLGARSSSRCSALLTCLSPTDNNYSSSMTVAFNIQCRCQNQSSAPRLPLYREWCKIQGIEVERHITIQQWQTALEVTRRQTISASFPCLPLYPRSIQASPTSFGDTSRRRQHCYPRCCDSTDSV